MINQTVFARQRIKDCRSNLRTKHLEPNTITEIASRTNCSLARNDTLLIVLTILTFLLSGCVLFGAKKDDIDTLLSLKTDQDYQEQVLKNASKSFDAILLAIDYGRIKIGEKKGVIEQKIGKPTINYPPTDTEQEQWIYRPGRGDWLGGKKIRLFFDSDGKLSKWECIKVGCKDVKSDPGSRL